MTNYLGKKYKLDSSENFEEYMKAIGVSESFRKIGASMTSWVQLVKNSDGSYSLNIPTTFKDSETKFVPGEEFEETTPDGRKVKTVITVEGDKVTQVQRGEVTATTVRTFTDSQVTAVQSAGDVVSTRIFKLDS